MCWMALCAAAPVAAFGEPVLEWKSTRERVKAGVAEERVEAVYRFTNAGSEPVTLQGASCACPGVRFRWDREELVYGPGEAGTLTVCFELGEAVGTQNKRIGVLGEARRELAVLRLEVQIADVLALGPLVVFWEAGEPQGAQREVRIGVPAGSEILGSEVLEGPFEVEWAQDPSPGERVLAIRAIDTGKKLTGSVAIDARSGEGPRRRYVLRATIK